MKQVFAKNIAALFLACLFIFNGLCSSFPGLFCDDEYDIENVIGSETEKKSNSERPEQELKELYCNSVYPPYLSLEHLANSQKINTFYNIAFRDDILISTPTPPPKS